MLERLINGLRNDPTVQYGGKRLESGGISFQSRKKNRKRGQKTLEERINILEKQVAEMREILETISGNSDT
jgi:hypothetical protein